MERDVQSLVEAIHDSPTMAVVVVSGAGAQSLAWLLAVAGASRTLLEAIVPYGRKSMGQVLGHEPTQYASLEVTEELAQAAYEKALDQRENQEPVVGLACTASIATDRPKRGDHRCSVAVWDDSGLTTYDLTLAKGERDRAGEEEVVSRLVLQALANACDAEQKLSLGLLDSEDPNVKFTQHADPLRLLLSTGPEDGEGSVRTVLVDTQGKMAANASVQGAILAGSFSPLHFGHEQLAQVAGRILNNRVAFELSVTNVDKPPLEEAEVRRRLLQFRGKWRVILTRAPTFHEKAAQLAGCTFVIGYDTAVRLVHPRYYGGSAKTMHAALKGLRDLDCRFLVAGRVDGEAFHTLDEVDIPEEFADMFEAIPETMFRADITSTELREAAAS